MVTPTSVSHVSFTVQLHENLIPCLNRPEFSPLVMQTCAAPVTVLSDVTVMMSFKIVCTPALYEPGDANQQTVQHL